MLVIFCRCWDARKHIRLLSCWEILRYGQGTSYAVNAWWDFIVLLPAFDAVSDAWPVHAECLIRAWIWWWRRGARSTRSHGWCRCSVVCLSGELVSIRSNSASTAPPTTQTSSSSPTFPVYHAVLITISYYYTYTVVVATTVSTL